MATAKWRADNPEKATEARRVSLRRWYANNKEKHKESSKEYRRKNLDKVRPKVAAAARRRRKENPEKVREKARVADAQRRARKLNAEGVYTTDDVENIRLRQENRCVYCEKEFGAGPNAFHVDHKTPLSRGGSNDPSNIQVLCPSCNVRKYNRTHEEYLLILSAANDNTITLTLNIDSKPAADALRTIAAALSKAADEIAEAA